MVAGGRCNRAGDARRPAVRRRGVPVRPGKVPGGRRRRAVVRAQSLGLSDQMPGLVAQGRGSDKEMGRPSCDGAR
jgi:hypothetical protein